jgi:hypothetical protein
MGRFVHILALAAFLAVGVGTPVIFAGEPAPTEQKEKKDTNSGKADDESQKKEEKKAGQ